MTRATRPYVILVDSAEQHPFSFRGIRADAGEDYEYIDVQTEARCLGRHPNGLGDYSIDGYFGRVAIERKSCDDLMGTILGFNDGRRERFEQELRNLNCITAPLVVVEATIPEVLANAYDTENKSADVNRKILHRSILAYMQDYRVPWYFAGSREMAEVASFRFLDRYWDKHREKKRGRRKC